jgi:hypothetical protein
MESSAVSCHRSLSLSPLRVHCSTTLPVQLHSPSATPLSLYHSLPPHSVSSLLNIVPPVHRIIRWSAVILAWECESVCLIVRMSSEVLHGGGHSIVYVVSQSCIHVYVSIYYNHFVQRDFRSREISFLMISMYIIPVCTC